MEQLTQQSVKPNFNIDYIIGKHSSSFSKCSLFQATQTHKKKSRKSSSLSQVKANLCLDVPIRKYAEDLISYVIHGHGIIPGQTLLGARMEYGFHLCLLPQKVFNSVLHRNTVTSKEGNISMVFHEMFHLSALPSNLVYWAVVCSGFKCTFLSWA